MWNCKGENMLKRFEVQYFKGFDQCIVLDFTARDYTYNSELVKGSVVNKAIIYGRNGIGKSSLGIALFDIVLHLTDKERMPAQYLLNYHNLNHVTEPIYFKYVFLFGEDEVIYEYHKADANNLIDEKLTVNGAVYIDYHYFNHNQNYISPDIYQKIRSIELIDNKLSVLKYLYRNTPTNSIKSISTLIQFCERMLWYRSLSEGNAYAGFKNGSEALTEEIYKTGRLKEFESFLRDNGVEYRLKFESVNGEHVLFALFDEGGSINKVPFLHIASTGTATLLLFYYWMLVAFDSVSFLFIDEFDAFLHFESAEKLVLSLNKYVDCQTVLTTHNTNLMTNRLTRPDCCFVMSKNKISSLKNATRRELREGHNLEKLYLSGEFDET